MKRAIPVVVSPIGAIYSTDEVAQMLGVHRHTVQRLIRAGELGAIKVGRRLRVTDEQLRAFVQQQQVHTMVYPRTFYTDVNGLICRI